MCPHKRGVKFAHIGLAWSIYQSGATFYDDEKTKTTPCYCIALYAEFSLPTLMEPGQI